MGLHMLFDGTAKEARFGCELLSDRALYSCGAVLRSIRTTTRCGAVFYMSPDSRTATKNAVGIL
jgi:hypothetical protein